MPDTTTNTMYPLISEYRAAILSPEDSFQELATLRPVLDSRGFPVMSSGNFAVVFKMKDENDGKLYAVKCFLKDQSGRDESYRRIAEELEVVSSAYILPLRYLEGELFVDSPQCSREEFPVVVMEWVEGETLDAYVRRNLTDKYALATLSYRFNRMAAWLLAQPFAHGDLKPDNIIVRADGTLVMVDYDGMFVPAMKGEKARETGSPGYRHPLRTDADFSEHIDDFSIALIALSLKALSLRPELKKMAAGDALLLSEDDLREPSESAMLKEMQSLVSDQEFATLFGIFHIALAKNSLEALSFRLFMTPKPKIQAPLTPVDTSCTDADLAAGVPDEYGVLYSPDGKRLLTCKSTLTLSEYKIKPGTEVICNNAFFGCWSLESVSIPSSVTSIGGGAFHGCTSLKSVIIPSSVSSIGGSAFWGCASLESVIIPSSVSSIEVTAFFKCASLKSVIIPPTVTFIGNRAFSGCRALESVIIPPSVRSIGEYAFDGCETLKCVRISSSVTKIANYAFSHCWSLESVIIPSSVTSIGECAFYECWHLESISIPLSVTTIGEGAFAECKSLKSVIIPPSMTLIGGWVFHGCESLENVIIPSSVTSIGESTFHGCASLESVSIPSSVTKIGDSAFAWCSSLKSVNIPSSVTLIGGSAFWECQSLKKVIIPSSVTKIEDCAFQRCASLESVIIPPSVTSIGHRAFSFCRSLESVSIPSSVTSIESCAFDDCDSLKWIYIPESVKDIGRDAIPRHCVIKKIE